jgi:hypothetical protein
MYPLARLQVSRVRAGAETHPEEHAQARPPRLVFITDSGRTIRFLSAKDIVPMGDRWAKWIADGQWASIEPWTSRWKSGGDR